MSGHALIQACRYFSVGMQSFWTIGAVAACGFLSNGVFTMYPANRDEILKGLKNLADCMEQLLKSAHEQEIESDATKLELHFKLVKQIVFQVDNSLGDLQDLLDTMDYHQDEKLPEAKNLVNQVEELTTKLVDYLRKNNKY